MGVHQGPNAPTISVGVAALERLEGLVSSATEPRTSIREIGVLGNRWAGGHEVSKV